ncbi:MAG: hypothetical protein AAFP88_03090, partial [Bacteroidota bacterium]
VLALLSLSLVAEVTALMTALLLLKVQTKLSGLRRMAAPYGLGLATIATMAIAIRMAPDNIAGITPLSLLAVGFFLAAVASCRTLLTELKTRLLPRR